MAVTESQVAALELEKVLPKIQKAYESEGPFFKEIEKRPAEKVSSRLMRIPLELRPGGDFGYFNPDGGDLGRGGGPTWDKAVVNCVFMKEGIEYTKLVQWSTDSDRKAIAQGVRKLTAGALIELRRQIDAQLMQDGTGSIGLITSDTPAGGSNVLLMDSGNGSRLVRHGQQVQVFDTLLTTNRGTATVTGNDSGARQLTLTPQIPGVVAGDVLVTQGITTPSSFPALLGVPYHHNSASTGTWLGFPRATYPEVRSNRINAAGNGLTLGLPRLAMNAIGNRLGSDNKYRLQAWMHPAQMAAYEEIGQLVTVINKSNSGGKNDGLDLYFGGNMTMAGAQVKTSFNWNTKRIDFINMDAWGRAEMLPIGFYKTDGRSIFEIRGASGGVATADIFYMVVGMQTFVNNPGATAYIDNLAVPTGY